MARLEANDGEDRATTSAVTTGAVYSTGVAIAAAWAYTEGSGAAICAYASTPGCGYAIWSAYSIPTAAGRVGGVRAAPRRARSSAMRANSRWEIATQLASTFAEFMQLSDPD